MYTYMCVEMWIFQLSGKKGTEERDAVFGRNNLNRPQIGNIMVLCPRPKSESTSGSE